jgi:RNA polymerase sigma-70 factor, ECF subfamily
MEESLPAIIQESMAAQSESVTGLHTYTVEPERTMTESDEQLMVAFSRGSVDAFDELFVRYKQPLFGFFRRRVMDSAQAEELTQEAFLAVIRSAPRCHSGALFRTYLYAIGLKILRAYRRKAVFRAMFMGIREEHREPASEDHLDAELSLRQAVGRLKPADREVLMLREFEELNYGEIAELLHLPINTVRSRLFRARMALRDLLTAEAPARADSNLTRFEEGL